MTAAVSVKMTETWHDNDDPQKGERGCACKNCNWWRSVLTGLHYTEDLGTILFCSRISHSIFQSCKRLTNNSCDYLYSRSKNEERKKLSKTIALQFIRKTDHFITVSIIYNFAIAILLCLMVTADNKNKYNISIFFLSLIINLIEHTLL